MTRRTFAATLAAAQGGVATMSAKPFAKPIGVQLYTARGPLQKDAEGTLKRIAALGYREIELFHAAQIETWVPMAAGLGMKATSIHVADTISLADDSSKFEATLGAAKKAGLSYAGVPYVAPKDRGTGAAFWAAWSKKMNRAGEIAKKAGMKFFYHHHAFEFAGTPGERAIDFMKKELDPKLVTLEMDVFWIAAAGYDPIDVLGEWKGRVALMHVKDKAATMGKIATESEAKPGDFKEVGAGTLDFKKLLNAALKSGVDKFYVEQDQCPGDPVDSLARSYEYLKNLSL